MAPPKMNPVMNTLINTPRRRRGNGPPNESEAIGLNGVCSERMRVVKEREGEEGEWIPPRAAVGRRRRSRSRSHSQSSPPKIPLYNSPRAPSRGENNLSGSGATYAAGEAAEGAGEGEGAAEGEGDGELFQRELAS